MAAGHDEEAATPNGAWRRHIRLNENAIRKKKIRVLCAGDRWNATSYLAGLLQADWRLEILGGTPKIEEAVRAACALRPDVVLLLTGESAWWAREFLALLSDEFGGAVLLAASGMPIGAIAQLLQAGASGVVSLGASSITDLPGAIVRVLQQEIWIDSFYWKPLIAAAAWAGTPAAELCSQQEREILTWVIRGLRNKDIAARLAISVTAVKAGLQRLFRKYAVHTRAQLVSAAAAYPAGGHQQPFSPGQERRSARVNG